MATTPWTCGIDFGTCFTTVACRPDDGAPRLVPLDFGARGDARFLFPSVAYVDDGGYLTGGLAEQRGRERPSRLARSPKLALGTGFDDDQNGLWDVVDEDDDLVVPVPELCGAIIAAAYRQACAHEGGPPRRVRVGWPAAWRSATERERAMLRALAWAGLPHAELVSEVDAAARALFLLADRVVLSDGAPVVVYDLGGGTCDVAVFPAGRGGPEVLWAQGRDDVGGEEFDSRLAAYLAPAGAAPHRLMEEVVAAKHRLSTEAVVPVRGPDVVLARHTLESCIAEPLALTVQLLLEVLDTAGVAPSEVNTTYVTGGSSRIPRVAATLRAVLGGEVVPVDRPKAVVALGATVDWPRRHPYVGVAFRPNESPFAFQHVGKEP